MPDSMKLPPVKTEYPAISSRKLDESEVLAGVAVYAGLMPQDLAVMADVHQSNVKSLLTVLTHLPPLQRKILELRFVEEKTEEEISQQLSLPVERVRNLQQSAETTLRAVLYRSGLGELPFRPPSAEELHGQDQMCTLNLIENLDKVEF